jgi:glutamate-1-semialdehyde 2,1-aminomutase
MKLCRSNQRMILNKNLIYGCSDLFGRTLCFAKYLHKLWFRNPCSAKLIWLGNSVYVCTEHTPEVLDGFYEALDPVFSLIQECEQGRDVMSLLKGPICHAGFNRLN